MIAEHRTLAGAAERLAGAESGTTAAEQAELPRHDDDHARSAAEPVTSAGVPASDLVEAGEPACWAHLVCPECGAVESEGHRPGCRLTAETS